MTTRTIAITVRTSFLLPDIEALSPEDGEIVLASGYRCLLESRKEVSDRDIGALVAKSLSDARTCDQKTISRLDIRVKELEAQLSETIKIIQEERRRTDEKISEKDTQIIEKDRMLSEHRIRQANPSLKGGDFQKDVANILHSIGAEIIEKPQYHSGDHWIRIDGLQIMIEEKSGANGGNSKELEKAYKDFQLHPSCNALIYLNKDYPIPGRKDVDFEVLDGRPACFVSNFDKKNREDVIRMVVQAFSVIIPAFIKPKTDNDRAVLVEKIKHIRHECENSLQQIKAIDDMKNTFSKTMDDINAGWSKLKLSLTSLMRDSKMRMRGIMGESVEDTVEESVEDVCGCVNVHGKPVKHRNNICPKA